MVSFFKKNIEPQNPKKLENPFDASTQPFCYDLVEALNYQLDTTESFNLGIGENLSQKELLEMALSMASHGICIDALDDMTFIHPELGNSKNFRALASYAFLTGLLLRTKAGQELESIKLDSYSITSEIHSNIFLMFDNPKFVEELYQLAQKAADAALKKANSKENTTVSALLDAHLNLSIAIISRKAKRIEPDTELVSGLQKIFKIYSQAFD